MASGARVADRAQQRARGPGEVPVLLPLVVRETERLGWNGDLGFGRIVASEIETPNVLANLV